MRYTSSPPFLLTPNFLEEASSLERISRRLVDMLEPVRTEMYTPKPTRDDNEDILNLENFKEMLESGSSLRLTIIIVVYRQPPLPTPGDTHHTRQSCPPHRRHPSRRGTPI